MKKRIILILCLLCLTAAALPVTAFADTAYTINGVTVCWDDFKSRPGNCRAYAEKMYEKIWGTGFSSYFDDENNMLRNLEDEELTLTEEHLKEYVTQAALGSTIRVSAKSMLHLRDGSAGHSQIIVQKDENGFTVLEGGMMEYPYCGENYYTWSEYVNAHWLGGRYGYIKYIKWPGAREYTPNYDAGIPKVSTALITAAETEDGFNVSFTATDDVGIAEVYIRVWPQGLTEEDGTEYPCQWDGITASVSVTLNEFQDDVRNFCCKWYAVDGSGNVGAWEGQPRLISFYSASVECAGICHVTAEDAVVCNAPYFQVNGGDTAEYSVSLGSTLSIIGVHWNADGEKWYRLQNGLWISGESARYDTLQSLAAWYYTGGSTEGITYVDRQILFTGA